MGPSHGSLTPGPGGATAVSLGGAPGGVVGVGVGGQTCLLAARWLLSARRCPPAMLAHLQTCDSVYFPPPRICLFVSPWRSPDSHESHLYFSLWRKSVSLRSKSDFSAPLPEQNDAVCDYFYRRRGVIQYLYWSIMIYITLYGQTRFSKKGTLTCTIDTTYGLQTLNFRSHTFVSLVQCLHISSLAATVSSPLFFLDTTSALRPFQLKWTHKAGSQLVQMSHETKRRRRAVIDGKIITGRHYWPRRRQKRRKQIFIEI